MRPEVSLLDIELERRVILVRPDARTDHYGQFVARHVNVRDTAELSVVGGGQGGRGDREYDVVTQAVEAGKQCVAGCGLEPHQSVLQFAVQSHLGGSDCDGEFGEPRSPVRRSDGPLPPQCAVPPAR
jgi:hypothetical protein